MDFALLYDRTQLGFDLQIDAASADFVREDTLKTAVILSLLSDRTAQAHEVDAGADRRGWWADAFDQVNPLKRQAAEAFGSRLWLLAREKQLPSVQERVREYVRESLAWMVEDGMALSIDVTVFVPRIGWYVADVALGLNSGNRRFRFEWDVENRAWHLAGELA